MPCFSGSNKDSGDLFGACLADLGRADGAGSGAAVLQTSDAATTVVTCAERDASRVLPGDRAAEGSPMSSEVSPRISMRIIAQTTTDDLPSELPATVPQVIPGRASILAYLEVRSRNIAKRGSAAGAPGAPGVRRKRRSGHAGRADC